MSSKPILFNTEMVKAILDGRKTQFRKHTGNYIAEDGRYEGFRNKDVELVNGIIEIHTTLARKISSKYKVGDVLWVREPAKVKSPPIATCKKLTFKYLADNKITEIYLDDDFDYSKKWIQRCQGVPNGCIKEMARIFLKVTNVRVERLQDISDEDCIKEGISEVGFYPDEGFPLCSGYMIGKDDGKTALANNPQKPFGELWNSTAKNGCKWEDNPYVFVYEFERIEKQ